MIMFWLGGMEGWGIWDEVLCNVNGRFGCLGYGEVVIEWG